MSQALEWIAIALPACGTFGVLFLVIPGKTEKHTARLRYLGGVMVGLALVTLWLTTEWQGRRINLLEKRLDALEASRQ